MQSPNDGSELLTGPQAADLLESAVSNAGGLLQSWALDHVDHRPGRSTKALFRAEVAWPHIDGPDAAPREELFGASSAAVADEERGIVDATQSLVMTDGFSNVRMWRYPHDPWLPALPKVCYPENAQRTLFDMGLLTPDEYRGGVSLDVITYRPGRRAVIKATTNSKTVFMKVLLPRKTRDIIERHNTLFRAGVPVPEVLGSATTGLVVLAALPGMPLATSVLTQGAASCDPRQIVAMLDRLPASMLRQKSRPGWSESVQFYADVISAAMPALSPRLHTLARTITGELQQITRRTVHLPPEVTHGDFYEAQVFVADGRIVGLLDIDTVGPGRRADDLACLLAHLSVLANYGSIGRAPAEIVTHVNAAVREWAKVFDTRVDPRELRLRAAGVVISLATGPHRQQEPDWEIATEAMVTVAESWVAAATFRQPHQAKRA